MTSFRDLHQSGNPFILANAWDLGSARIMAALGAKAIATTSAGHAFTIGRPDMGNVTRSEAIEHAKDLIKATALPVSGDLENGYGDDAESVAETITIAGNAGLAGACIEDTDLPSTAPYEFSRSVERIEAAIEAARKLDDDFVLVARADGFMNGQYDFAEAMRRAKAFEAAGADAIYIPALTDLAMVREVCREIKIPVNILCAGKLIENTMEDFASAGVARISLGSMMASVTHKAIVDMTKQMLHEGEFGLLKNTPSDGVIDALLIKGAGE